MAAYLMKGREESSMHLYSMKYGNDHIWLVYTRSSASYMPCYFNSYEISWSVLRFFATIVFIGCFTGQHSNWLCFEQSNDQSPPHCRMVSLTTKYQPAVDQNWTVFCAPSLVVFVLDLAAVSQEQPWHVTIYCLYKFRMRSAMITFAPPCLLNTISPPLS